MSRVPDVRNNNNNNQGIVGTRNDVSVSHAIDTLSDAAVQ